MQDRIVRKRLIFSGAVQGVGFRWRSRQAASAAGATGWVQNEGDGSVTMELQGTEEQIDRVLQALDRSLFIQISELDVRTVPLQDGERDFSVRDDRW